jgi:PAS domain S-box-containing protein
MLKDYGYQVITASNGQECIERTLFNSPDLIILDWNMPVLDGISTLEKLKQDESTKEIPVVMITGVMSSAENLALAMSIGAIDFLRKPFDKLELNARVTNILLLTETLKSLKEQRLQLQNTNIFITSLIESIPQPLIYCSLDGIILMCNKYFEQLLGLNRNEILSTPVYRYFLRDEVGYHFQIDVDMVESKLTTSYESKAFPGNRTFFISKNIVTNDREIPVGIITVFTDITELKNANEEVINTKKIELVANTLHLMHVTEMNTSLINDLSKVNQYTNKEGRELIGHISNKFKLNMAEQIWNDFEERFESAFDSFYKVLLAKFPNLTPAERKLCALLRSGLSSKDIAILTFQMPQSIDVARYRLRKKFNLGTEEKLMDFLLTIDQ